ncbi:MAPK-interacting and spindle-stabilizing protein-like [Numida meleagris]|uniref:MAPK-interacting and spindle-stabilizing protein-like n=1 Tax=Numida meleagris TaxID=8996 RepID=UPI000B3DCFEA|nr:MAPK-interacting and spindle-stabilizing protein-like [Numida meleagris]
MPVYTSRLPHFLKAAGSCPGTAHGSSPAVPRCLPPRTPAEARLYRGPAHCAPRPSPNGVRAAPLAPRWSTGGARKRLPGAAGRLRAPGPGRAPSGFPVRSPQRRPPAPGRQRPPREGCLSKSEQTAIYYFLVPFFSLGSNRNRVSHRAEL